MILERENDEILVRLSSKTDLSELQDIIDYLKYKELTANSQAKQKDVDILSKEINSLIWSKIKTERSLK